MARTARTARTVVATARAARGHERGRAVRAVRAVRVVRAVHGGRGAGAMGPRRGGWRGTRSMPITRAALQIARGRRSFCGMCPNFDAIVIKNSPGTLGCLSQKAFLGGFEMP